MLDLGLRLGLGLGLGLGFLGFGFGLATEFKATEFKVRVSELSVAVVKKKTEKMIGSSSVDDAAHLFFLFLNNHTSVFVVDASKGDCSIADKVVTFDSVSAYVCLWSCLVIVSCSCLVV
jgi:hypothetical protein